MTKIAKTPRDINAPKRNMSTYLMYQNAMRDQFKAQNPGMTFGQLAKYTSAMYSEMAPHEKGAWKARAEADKARYLHELATYVPPPGYDAKGDAIFPAIANESKKGKRTKYDRDVNAPKRNVPTFILYQNAMRDRFKSENPGMTFGQLSKYTSHMYKALTPDQKSFWEQKALEDKKRYEIEMSQYIPPPGHDAKGNFLESKVAKKKRKKSTKDPAAPKRARGSYVFFTYDARPEIMRQNPGIKFTDLGHVMGQYWRALSPEEKRKYEDLASQDKIRFAQEMEQYNANQRAENKALEDQRAENKALEDQTLENAQLLYQQQLQQQQQQQQEQMQLEQQRQEQLHLQQEQLQLQQDQLQLHQQKEQDQDKLYQQEYQHPEYQQAEYQQAEYQPQEYQQQQEYQQPHEQAFQQEQEYNLVQHEQMYVPQIHNYDSSVQYPLG
eukprot:CAMPEP_0113306564 /NCGR_PEP_ID=MMETSP0010_2-20120614/5763_1 /TAXON_ID=216773 ORGANISM="Corethron hystrix, Strain 308" /NCGR_SAMPLE_ID=MMETSP0010_2 /ASSEMBLY_ACC=CAM_ASM_000155 /LENGTH=438 /DNA_ID=CAMNT_0000161253 /DNA_START=1122 /DNA_END=2438 /DNA_ORIENTATION=- /assembly_acc=CAM_ASM_000155